MSFSEYFGEKLSYYEKIDNVVNNMKPPTLSVGILIVHDYALKVKVYELYQLFVWDI